MIYGESTAHLISSLLAISVVALMVKILDKVSAHSKVGTKVIYGHARLLIQKGKIIKEALQKENLSEDDLLSLLREHGVDSPIKVKKAFMESDGELSVVEFDSK
jgi:uncharacterized membrane protein YcaP (DUF421 family)